MCDELSYWAVSGVTYSRVGLMGSVTLHSRLGDIQVRTLNQRCAMSFVRSVESKLFEPDKEGEDHDNATQKRILQVDRDEA